MRDSVRGAAGLLWDNPVARPMRRAAAGLGRWVDPDRGAADGDSAGAWEAQDGSGSDGSHSSGARGPVRDAEPDVGETSEPLAAPEGEDPVAATFSQADAGERDQDPVAALADKLGSDRQQS